MLVWFSPILGATSVDLGPALTQIGIGALIAVPAYVTSWKLWQMMASDRAKTEALQAERIEDQKTAILRERELADRLGPLLAEAARVLSTAPGRFDQALKEAKDSRSAGEVERLVHGLEDAIARISRERGGA